MNSSNVSGVEKRREKLNKDWINYGHILNEEGVQYDKWERWEAFEGAWRLQQARIDRLEEALKKICYSEFNDFEEYHKIAVQALLTPDSQEDKI